MFVILTFIFNYTYNEFFSFNKNINIVRYLYSNPIKIEFVHEILYWEVKHILLKITLYLKFKFKIFDQNTNKERQSRYSRKWFVYRYFLLFTIWSFDKVKQIPFLSFWRRDLVIIPKWNVIKNVLQFKLQKYINELTIAKSK